MTHIGIIGSGPVGALAALKLLRAGFKVTILDIGKEYAGPSIHSDDSEIKTEKLKTFKGSTFLYDLNQNLVIDSVIKSPNLFPSQSKEGFSLVWGATWEKFDTALDLNYEEAYSELDLIIFGLLIETGKKFGPLIQQNLGCNCFVQNLTQLGLQNKFALTEIDFQVPELAISSSKCIFHGGCVNGCIENAIWSSADLLQACEFYEQFTYLGGTFITSVVEVNCSYVEVHSERGILHFDSVFICAGPIGSSAIVLRSNYAKEITLHDTRLGIMAFINLHKSPKHDSKFSLAGLSLNIDLRKKDPLKVKLQLYAHTEEFTDRILSKVPKVFRPITRIIFAFLRRRLILSLIYLPQEISTPLNLKWNLEKQNLQISPDDGGHEKFASFRMYFYLLLNSIKTGLVPIPYINLGAPGDSYHTGAAQIDSGISGNGAISPRIRILGAFSLPKIAPGAITRTAMAKTLIDLNTFLESEN